MADEQPPGSAPGELYRSLQLVAQPPSITTRERLITPLPAWTAHLVRRHPWRVAVSAAVAGLLLGVILTSLLRESHWVKEPPSYLCYPPPPGWAMPPGGWDIPPPPPACQHPEQPPPQRSSGAPLAPPDGRVPASGQH